MAEGALAAPKISNKTIYFTVGGSTPAAVLSSILRNNPSRRSVAAMATTQANISQTLKPKGKNGCRYSSKAVITIRLPRLSKSSRKYRSVRAVWGSFDKYIRGHEARHQSIYLACARNIDKRARAYIRKNGCKNAQLAITKIMVDERLRCNRLNALFDQRERSRIRRLPLITQAKLPNRKVVANQSIRKEKSKQAATKKN